MNNIIIKKPIISEKSFALASEGVYVFAVSKSANKKVVAEQIHKLFKVDVTDVRMINIPGKVKRTGRKTGRRSDIKKALVRVKKGQKISIFETEEKAEKKDQPKIEEKTAKKDK